MVDARAREIIEECRGLKTQESIKRLFAVAQIFYREPVGVMACDALADLIGVEASSVMFWIYGLARGSGLACRKVSWEEIAEWK